LVAEPVQDPEKMRAGEGGTAAAWLPVMGTMAHLAGVWIATWLLLLLPDFALYWSGYAVEAATKLKQLLFAGLVALLITTAKSRSFRLAAIAFLLVNQIVWIGYVVYFGEPLSPEHLLLVQEEVDDTVVGALAEWRSLLPWFLGLLALGATLAALQWREGRNAGWRWRGSGWIFCILVGAATTAWMLHPRIDAAFPGAHTSSMYGPYQAAVGSLRLGLTSVAAKSLHIHGQTQTQASIPAEPVTVVFVMGESINASRLSLFGFKANTTPELAKWRATPPEGFTFIPEIGFSGGLDTFASVPMFLRAAYWPVQAQKFGVNLFELAHREGFKSWYLSAQTLNFLKAAGGAPHAERIATAPDDDGLAKLAAEIPDRGENSFIFLHQRVNHSPYTTNCATGLEGLSIFKPETESAADQRRAAYDNGLRCWDRQFMALIAPFLKRRGAVHIFYMSDHNELMAENGRWGHGFADLRVAMVPMMLLTNRPDSEVATLFKSWSPPTTYHLAQTVALAFGVRLETPDIATNRFFLNSTMPFALAGFMEVEQLEPGVYRVKRYARNGQSVGQEVTNLPEVAAANRAYGPALTKSAPQAAFSWSPKDKPSRTSN
jgi:glucan phosphoethanolaminetransferase (alkaline phosphatase superfamily)